MLEVRLRDRDRQPIAEELRRLIRIYTAAEILRPKDLEKVHRAARMCWEALERGTLSSLDSHDCDILYEVRMEPDVEWVFRILNYIRGLLRAADTTPDMADRWAKDVALVMQS